MNTTLTISVLLATAIVAVILTRKAKLSAVLGYLLAGILVGPWGVGLVKDPTEILHLAEFGIVLLLFVIGLELKPQRLWVMRKPVFLLGGLQVLVTTLLLALAIHSLGFNIQAALIAGFGLSLSSTALVVQILAERNARSISFQCVVISGHCRHASLGGIAITRCRTSGRGHDPT
jgi:glutathione-regulated potassium-efflux system ancillary protein KefC